MQHQNQFYFLFQEISKILLTYAKNVNQNFKLQRKKILWRFTYCREIHQLGFTKSVLLKLQMSTRYMIYKDEINHKGFFQALMSPFPWNCPIYIIGQRKTFYGQKFYSHLAEQRKKLLTQTHFFLRRVIACTCAGTNAYKFTCAI